MKWSRSYFSQLFAAPDPSAEEHVQTEAFLVRFAWFNIVIFPLGILGVTIASPEYYVRSLITVLAVVAVYSFALFLVKHGRIITASYLIVGFLWLLVSSLAFTGGGVEAPSYIGYFVVAFLAGILLGGRALFIVTGISIGSGLFMVFLFNAGKLPVDRYSETPVVTWIIATILMVFQALLQTYNRAVAKQSLERAHSELVERKRAENSLRESESQLSTIFDASPVAIGISRLPEGRIISVNAAFEKMYGFSRQEAIGHTTEELNIWGSAVDRKRFVDALKTDGVVHGLETTARLSSGVLRNVLVSGKAVDINGEPCLMAQIVDITDRKQAEKKLQDSEIRFATVFEYSPVPKTLTRLRDNHLLDVNAAWADLWGYEKNDAVGKTALELGLWINPSDRDRMLIELRSQGYIENFETQLRSRTRGDRAVLISARQADIQGDACLILQTVDITERKRAEQKLRKQLDAQKMLAEISEQLTKIEISNRDQTFTDALARFGNQVEAERCYIYTYQPLKDLFTSIYEWSADGLALASNNGRSHPAHDSSDLFQSILRGEVLNVPRLTEWSDADPEAVRLRAEGVRSLLWLPMFGENGILGLLGFESLSRENAWQDLEINLLSVVGRIFANGLERLQKEIEILELNQSLEQRVRDRTAEVQDLYDNAPAGYHSLDIDGKIISVNQTQLNWLGYAREELIGRPLSDFMPEQSRVVFQERFLLFMKAGAFNDLELELVRKDGSILPVLVNALAVYDQHGNYVSSRSTVFDNTERKAAEAAIRESETTYRALFENSNDGIFLLSPTGEELQVNQHALKMLGYSFDEYMTINHDRANAIVEDTAQRRDADQKLAAIMRGERVALYEREFVSRDGRKIPVEINLSPVRNSAGQIVMVQSVVRDVTQRKQAEAALQASLKRVNSLYALSQSVNQSRDLSLLVKVVASTLASAIPADRVSVIILDVQRQCIDLVAKSGSGLKKIVDVSYDEIWDGLSGWALRERKIAFSPHGQPDPRESLAVQRRRLETECGDIIVVPLVYQDQLLGTITAINEYGEAHRFKPDDLELVSAIANQASLAVERIRAETTLYQANQALERSMQLKDDFLANMSHELRTPLNGILGMSEILQDEIRGPLNERQQTMVKIIDSSGRHLLSLINDILDLSKIESGKLEIHKEPMSIGDLCQASLIFIKEAAIKKGILVEYLPDPQVTMIEADMRRMKQILVNLLSNAVKFTSARGKITLKVQAYPEKNSLDLSVSDTGIGIAPDDLQRLFTPFTQVDSSLTRQHEGTGLGLALTKRLTELHSGSIHVVSEPGKGSTFTVTLPWFPIDEAWDVRDASGLSDDSAGSAPRSALPAKKVLLVEDNQVNVMTIGEYLESAGYSMIYAVNGREAIEQARKYQPDIILMDVQMPEMDGLEATRRLRADPLFATVPIIALTAIAMSGDRERCLDAGATDYMSKPVSLKELNERIKKLVTPELD